MIASEAVGHYEIVAGVDEAGRGPLAGPVVAAAVILGDDVPAGLGDSKQKSARQRERLFEAAGLLPLQDAETGARRVVDTQSPAYRRALGDLLDVRRIQRKSTAAKSLVMAGDAVAIEDRTVLGCVGHGRRR